MPGFKLGEELSDWPDSSIFGVLKALTNAFLGSKVVEFRDGVISWRLS